MHYESHPSGPKYYSSTLEENTYATCNPACQIVRDHYQTRQTGGYMHGKSSQSSLDQQIQSLHLQEVRECTRSTPAGGEEYSL